MINNISQAIKNKFWVYFYFIILLNLEIFKDNDKNIKPFITCKYCWAIINIGKKALWDNYFDPINKKPIYKYYKNGLYKNINILFYS